MIHELKIKECYWKDVWNGRKTFEIRKKDRDFKVGDVIHFKPIYENGDFIELEPSIDEKYNRYVITYIFNGGEYGLNADYCVLAIRQVVSFKREEEPMSRVRDLVSCLISSPLDNLLEINIDEDKKTYYECLDVSNGRGTIQGFTYLDIRTNEEMSEPYRATNVWEPIVNAHGELTEFICNCGCSSQGASNYCPNCGTKLDNSDIEERIQKAIQEAI